MIRLTSTLFVAQLVRRVSGEGGFAAILRKGAQEAGAIHIVVRGRSGSVDFYRPAMQTSYDQETTGGRLFEHDEKVDNDERINEFLAREERFDTDFWVVELELATSPAGLPFAVIKP